MMPMRWKVIVLSAQLLAVLVACAGFQTVLHTAEDAARILCEIWATEQGDKISLKPQDFCAILENRQPFVDAALAAKREAGQTVGARVGVTNGDP